MVMVRSSDPLDIQSLDDAATLILDYYNEERDILSEISEKHRRRVLVRFRIGRVVSHVTESAEYGDGAVQKLAAKMIKSDSYLYQSRRFYEAHDGSEQACKAWLDEVEQEKGRVTWGYCKQWAKKQLSGDDYNEDQDKVEQEITRLERRAQRLDQDAQELEEQVHEANVDEDAKAEALGVAARARQVAEETRHKAETMELEDYERVEDEEYREWIRSQPCIVRDRTGDDVDPHHAIEGGQGSKASDYTCLPLCHDLHEELHGPNMSREKFEDKHNVDIWQEIADHITRFFTGRPINR